MTADQLKLIGQRRQQELAVICAPLTAESFLFAVPARSMSARSTAKEFVKYVPNIICETHATPVVRVLLFVRLFTMFFTVLCLFYSLFNFGDVKILHSTLAVFFSNL